MLMEVKTQIQSFNSLSYHQLTYNERRRVELSLLQCLVQVVANKTCLLGGLVPADLTSEYVAILDFMTRSWLDFRASDNHSG